MLNNYYTQSPNTNTNTNTVPNLANKTNTDTNN